MTRFLDLKKAIVVILVATIMFMMMPVVNSFNAYADTETPFTITVDGVKVDSSAIEKSEKAYAYTDYATKETAYYDLYIVKVSADSKKATLNFGEKECIAYNYDGAGNFLAGWLDDPTKGTKEIMVDCDSDKNKTLDFIQIQNAYNADWTGGEILYAIEFKADKSDESSPAPTMPSKESVQQMLLNVSITTKTTYTSDKNVKITYSLDNTTKGVIKELKDYGYTVKYQYYKSTKKNSGYVLMKTKSSNGCVNVTGKKGTEYFYKVRLAVYDNNKSVAKSHLPYSSCASKKWVK